MTSAYTNIPKPTDSNYTKVNANGQQGFDDPLVMFDDPNVFFDGGDGISYINIAKPIGSPYTSIAKPTT